MDGVLMLENRGILPLPEVQPEFNSIWTSWRNALSLQKFAGQKRSSNDKKVPMVDKTRTELEAATFRRLLEHLRERTDVQNIDLMNLAGFCRDCLSRWYRAEAEARGVPLSDSESREIVYGMPYDEWRAKFQKEASTELKAAFRHDRRRE
jgi:hypothetical protein